MKKIYKYISTMYRPAFITLTLGLSLFSAGLGTFAVTLRQELLAGARGVSLIYTPILEELILLLSPLLITVFAIDLIERKKHEKGP